MNLLAKKHNKTDVNKVYCASMGKIFQVTGIFKNDDDANSYLATHKDEGVIADFHGLVFVAAFNDTKLMEVKRSIKNV